MIHTVLPWHGWYLCCFLAKSVQLQFMLCVAKPILLQFTRETQPKILSVEKNYKYDVCVLSITFIYRKAKMADTDEHAETMMWSLIKARNAETITWSTLKTMRWSSIECAVLLIIKCNSCKCKRLEWEYKMKLLYKTLLTLT